MDDSDKPSGGEATGEGDSPGGNDEGPPPSPRPQQPIGGMVRDPREVKTNPSLTRFLRERMSAAFVSGLVSIGVLRPRTPSATSARVAGRALFAFLGAIFAIVFVWTSVHVVQPGTVAVPVTFGDSGKPLTPGFHITLPFTTAYSMSTRTQNYTMSSLKGEGSQKNSDDSVAVLGRDGGSANVNAHGAVPARPEEGYRRVTARSGPTTRPRSSARRRGTVFASSSRVTTSSPRPPRPGTRSKPT